MDDKIKAIMRNPITVMAVISKINAEFKGVVEKYTPTMAHRDPYHYFSYGACSNFAFILTNIFKDQVTGYYIDEEIGHAIIKIGEYCYDVTGLREYNPNWDYCEPEPAYLEMAFALYQRTDEYIKILAPILTRIGQEELNEIIEKHLDELKTKKH